MDQDTHGKVTKVAAAAAGGGSELTVLFDTWRQGAARPLRLLASDLSTRRPPPLPEHLQVGDSVWASADLYSPSQPGKKATLLAYRGCPATVRAGRSRSDAPEKPTSIRLEVAQKADGTGSFSLFVVAAVQVTSMPPILGGGLRAGAPCWAARGLFVDGKDKLLAAPRLDKRGVSPPTISHDPPRSPIATHEISCSCCSRMISHNLPHPPRDLGVSPPNAPQHTKPPITERPRFQAAPLLPLL